MLAVASRPTGGDRNDTSAAGSGGKDAHGGTDTSAASRPAQRLLLFYVVLACLCFWSSFGPHYIGLDNDVHHKVEMRLIAYTILAYGTTLRVPRVVCTDRAWSITLTAWSMLEVGEVVGCGALSADPFGSANITVGGLDVTSVTLNYGSRLDATGPVEAQRLVAHPAS